MRLDVNCIPHLSRVENKVIESANMFDSRSGVSRNCALLLNDLGTTCITAVCDAVVLNIDCTENVLVNRYDQVSS